MSEAITISGRVALPGGVQEIKKHDRGFVLVEYVCTKEVEETTATQGDNTVRVLKMDTAIRLDEEQVSRFHNQLAEAKAMLGKVDPRQGSLDGNGSGEQTLPVGNPDPENENDAEPGGGDEG